MRSEEEEKMYNLDELQAHLRKSQTISEAKSFLEKNNIDTKYVRVFLISEMIYKFPELFTDVSEELISISKSVYKRHHLQENLPKLKCLLNELKERDLNELKSDLENMQQRTRASSHETENTECIRCYETQEKIINTALNFFDKN